MESQKEIKPVEVFAGSPIQSGFIKSVLEENGIQVFLYNELMGNILPSNLGTDGFNPVKVMVSSVHKETSLQLIEELNNSDSTGQA